MRKNEEEEREREREFQTHHAQHTRKHARKRTQGIIHAVCLAPEVKVDDGDAPQFSGLSKEGESGPRQWHQALEDIHGKSRDVKVGHDLANKGGFRTMK